MTQADARDADVDVIVGGAGAAGLAAALRAAESGKTVALFEATEHFRTGNNTSMSTAMIPAGGSRWQREAGIEDSPALFSEDVMAKTHGEADPTTTAALTSVAPLLVEWLADSCGLPLSLVTDFNYPGHSKFRCHSIPERSGRSLLRHLLSAVDSRPNITLAVPMSIDDVLLDESGAVRAVVARSGGGETEELTCHATILASGGFGANRTLVAELIPEIAAATYHGGDGCKGDALRISQQLGADVGYLDAYQGHGSLAIPQATLMTWAAVMHGGIIVNRDGRRFADESQGYSEFAELVIAEPEAIAYMIIDERIDSLCRSFLDYVELVEHHGVQWAATAEELAARIDVDAKTLAETLDAVGAIVGAGATDSFGRTNFEDRLRAPYGAVKITGALFHTQGGALISPAAAVLRDGRPLPGLYAAGGAAAGMSGHGAGGYLAGNGLLAALGLGYLAGSDAGMIAAG